MKFHKNPLNTFQETALWKFYILTLKLPSENCMIYRTGSRADNSLTLYTHPFLNTVNNSQQKKNVNFLKSTIKHKIKQIHIVFMNM